MPRHRRALGYARVSSVEQALGTSLRDQQEAIRAYAKTCGVAVAKYYVEAESGIREKEERREQMQLLMRDVRAGDLVLCDKLDRWSRDPAFTYTSVKRILDTGASFYAVSDRCDPSTSEGDTAMGFRILFAREEHKRIKERMVGTRAILRGQGYYVEGVPPLGYRRTSPRGSRGLAKNVLVIIPEEAKIVRQIFRLYVGGKSMETIADELGLKLDRVKDVLHRRLYIGEIQTTASRPGARDGQWVKGQHEPIIDADLFSRAQAFIEQRRRGGRQPGVPSETSTWILRDVARCACGAKMGAAYAGPKGPGRRHYYHCTRRCGARFVPVTATETAFAELALERLAEIRDELAKGAAPKKSAAPDLTAQRAKLQRRRERYLEAFAGDLMTTAELRVAMKKLDAEHLRLDARAQELKTASPLDDVQVRRGLLASLAALSHAWRETEPAGRRKIVHVLTPSVVVAADTEPLPTWRTLEEIALVQG